MRNLYHFVFYFMTIFITFSKTDSGDDGDSRIQLRAARSSSDLSSRNLKNRRLCSEKFNPCHNGECINTPDGFTCACNYGFKGILCTEVITTCQKKKCANGGRCYLVDTTETCVCTHDYTGDTCDFLTPDAADTLERKKHRPANVFPLGIMFSFICLAMFLVVVLSVALKRTIRARKFYMPTKTFKPGTAFPSPEQDEKSGVDYEASQAKRPRLTESPESLDDFAVVGVSDMRPLLHNGRLFSKLHELASLTGRIGAELYNYIDCVNLQDEEGKYALHWVADAIDEKSEDDILADIETLRVRANQKLYVVDDRGATPLHYAIRRGRIRAAICLMTHQSAEKADIDGRTPLYDAVAGQLPEIVDVLIKTYKVDPNRMVGVNDSAMHKAVRMGSAGHSCLARLLAADSGLNINLVGNRDHLIYTGDTPLHAAVHCNNLPAARKLVQAGANANALDRFNKTPLDYAREHNNMEMINVVSSQRKCYQWHQHHEFSLETTTTTGHTQTQCEASTPQTASPNTTVFSPFLPS